MPNLTPNYSWNLPLVNNATDADLWGGQLNSNFSDLDTELKAVSDIANTSVLPIGSIYMNYSDGTNPGTLLGYGTWVAITDKFVVAKGATYVTTGGAATVTLSTPNLPSHNHTIYAGSGTGGGFTEGFTSNNNGSSGTPGITSSTGSGTAFSIIPPYQAVYMWYRSA